MCQKERKMGIIDLFGRHPDAATQTYKKTYKSAKN